MRRVVFLALGLVLAAGSGARAQPVAPAITVYAASDLDMAFREIKPIFEKATGTRVTLVMGSTGNLAKQIEHGAPADVFFAANASFVDDLQTAGAVIPQTRALYAQGRIVLATPTKSTVIVRELADLLKPEVRRVAIANPAHAPYGRAAQEALESAGVWERLKPKLVYGENIRHTLQFVETGAVEAGIVALSVAGVPDVRYVPIDPKLHKPLNQVAAVVKRSARPELGVAFIQFLNGPEGRPIMKRYGFFLPGEF
ncbi:MAG: molybdate ABC transporter substrate-binding protein [Candidatus Rokuibacteriota bacterium]|nr:MAG: molybdate ABC transporter substrate-binding protein [Candidatus Rokubacteria bacterium]